MPDPEHPPDVPGPPFLPLAAATTDLAALCGVTAADYLGLLLDLLPVGAAWPRTPDTILWRFWGAAAEEPARVHARGCDLLDESYPCGAVELLPEWEAACGLPNVCTEGIAWTLAERQALVCAWLSMRGGQSPAYFIALAASFGYTITITEHFAPQLGRIAMGCFQIGSCPFWWEVTIDGIPIVVATLGCWLLGEPLCGSGANIIECLIRLFAPAHTAVTFNYPAEVFAHADHA